MRTTITLLLLSALGLVALREAPGLAQSRLQLGPLTIQLQSAQAEVESVPDAPAAPSAALEGAAERSDHENRDVHPRCLILRVRPGAHTATS